MAWSVIDQTVETQPYAPITGRLMRKLRDRDRAVKRYTMQGFVQNGLQLAGDTSSAWQSAGVFFVYVPGWLVGDNGTTIGVVPTITVIQAGTGITQVSVRLAAGGEVSNEIGSYDRSSAGTTVYQGGLMELTWPGTADSVNGITVQMKNVVTATISGSGTFLLPGTEANNYLHEAD